MYTIHTSHSTSYPRHTRTATRSHTTPRAAQCQRRCPRVSAGPATSWGTHTSPKGRRLSVIHTSLRHVNYLHRGCPPPHSPSHPTHPTPPPPRVSAVSRQGTTLPFQASEEKGCEGVGRGTGGRMRADRSPKPRTKTLLRNPSPPKLHPRSPRAAGTRPSSTASPAPQPLCLQLPGMLSTALGSGLTSAARRGAGRDPRRGCGTRGAPRAVQSSSSSFSSSAAALLAQLC